jgi:hypothetical protein
MVENSEPQPADVVLLVEGERFPAHRCVLAARSGSGRGREEGEREREGGVRARIRGGGGGSGDRAGVGESGDQGNRPVPGGGTVGTLCGGFRSRVEGRYVGLCPQ